MLPDFGDSKGLTLSEGPWCLDGVPCHTHSLTLRFQQLKIGISRMDFSWVPPPSPPLSGDFCLSMGEGSTHYRNLFVFLLYLWEGVGVGKNSLSGQASSYSDLLSGHQKFTKISLSLSFLLFCHCAVRAESSQLPDSLNNIFYHSFPFSEFDTHVSHM